MLAHLPRQPTRLAAIDDVGRVLSYSHRVVIGTLVAEEGGLAGLS